MLARRSVAFRGRIRTRRGRRNGRRRGVRRSLGPLPRRWSLFGIELACRFRSMDRGGRDGGAPVVFRVLSRGLVARSPLSLSVRPHSPDIRAPTVRCLPLANVRNSLYFSFYVSVLLLLVVVPSLHGLTRAPLAPSLSLFRSSFGARSRPYRYRYDDDDDDDKDRSRALTTTDFQPPPVIEVFFSFFPSPVVPVIPLIPSIVDRCLSTRAPV